MDLDTTLTWAADRRNAVLITLRKDGRAQSSDISYAVVDGTFHISVTDDRAKTRNMRRDPRVVLHITDPGSWSYVSIDAMATITEPAAEPDDATADALVAYYRLVAGEHDDWDDYRAAMVADRRCIVTVTPSSVTGQIN